MGQGGLKRRLRSLSAATALLSAATASASPQGAEWETLDKPDGCASCHLAVPGQHTAALTASEAAAADSAGTAALAIEGLPDAVVPGRRYELTIVLRDPMLLIGGFLLGITSADADAAAVADDSSMVDAAAAPGAGAGTLEAGDERSEAIGARARSTRAGALPATPGELRWTLRWTAPALLAAPVRFELWGNAGNDDLSPLGDRIHHLRVELPAAD